MSFFDYYHRLFGDKKGDNNNSYNEGNDTFNNTQDSPPDFIGRDFDFSFMTDPFQMHRLFERNINDILKAFFSNDFVPGIGQNAPAIEEHFKPRDFYLKPEYNQTKPNMREGQENEDKRLDDFGWFEKLLPSNIPHHKYEQPHTFSSYRSVIRKTIRLPDGTVKTEEIIRNSDGTEQRTESQTLADKTPGISGSFGPLDVDPKFNKTSKYDFLKPGYEKPNKDKFDINLDEKTLLSGIKHIPILSLSVPDMPEVKFDPFTSYTKRTTTSPTGVVESEEIIRKPDGTEQKTVTTTVSDHNKLGTNNEYSMGLSFVLRGIKDLVENLIK